LLLQVALTDYLLPTADLFCITSYVAYPMVSYLITLAVLAAFLTE